VDSVIILRDSVEANTEPTFDIQIPTSVSVSVFENIWYLFRFLVYTQDYFQVMKVTTQVKLLQPSDFHVNMHPFPYPTEPQGPYWPLYVGVRNSVRQDGDRREIHSSITTIFLDASFAML